MAARVWSIENQKGGTTKTTTATNIAACLTQEHGKSVLLVDLDGRQGSSSDWAASRDDAAPLIPCVIMRETLKRDLPRISASYDYVIIDGIPNISELTSAAIKASDLVLVPVQPSQYDIWATSDIISLIKERQELTGGAPRAVIMVARAIVGTNIERSAKEAMAEFGFPVLKAQTHQRVAYVEGVVKGLSVMDLPKGDPARQEIEAITLELLEADK